MGQYRDLRGKRTNGIVITIDVVAKRHGDYFALHLPKSILKELCSVFGTRIFKLYITNGIKREYYWEYSERSNYISFSGLKPGKYKVSIEPYNLEKFIKEFNMLIKRKFNLKLKTAKNKLITLIGETFLETNRWIFIRERGGGIIIIAEYPSITHPKRKAKIKYQIKKGEANIYYQSENPPKAPSPQRLVALEPVEGCVKITYKHGKINRTGILSTKEIPSLPSFYAGEYSGAIAIEDEGELNLSGYRVKKFRFSILDPFLALFIDYQVKYSEILLHKDMASANGKMIREDVAKLISLEFLNMYGFSPIVDVSNNIAFRSKFPRIKPDFIAYKDDSFHLIEVKFRFPEKYMDKAFRLAIKQVKRQYDRLKEREPLNVYITSDIKLDTIHGYGAIVVSYSHRKKYGYIYFCHYISGGVE